MKCGYNKCKGRATLIVRVGYRMRMRMCDGHYDYTQLLLRHRRLQANHKALKGEFMVGEVN